MSPLRRESTIFLLSRLTEELNSESFWIDRTIDSAFHEETFRLLEGAATPLEGLPTLPTNHLLPSFDDDHLGPPSASPPDAERVNFVDFTSDVCPMPFGFQPGDLFDHTYQSAYNELFHNDYDTCIPAQTMTIYENPPLASALCDDSITPVTHLLPAPVDPSTMAAYAPYFDYGCDSSQAPSTPDNASVASPPPTSPSASSPYYDSSESDECDTDYAPPSDDDGEFHPTKVASSHTQKKHKVASKSSSSRRGNFSPTRSTSSESEKSISSSRAHRRSHPYKRRIPSRNFQREDGAVLIDNSGFRCPVVGCGYIQTNQRVPDLKRHVVTHDRWMEPEKWTCCGVTMDRAHLYGKGIKEGMTDEERIKAGAYVFNGRLMIGGCRKTFARRDALKRHVDNPNIPCVGHMETYYY